MARIAAARGLARALAIALSLYGLYWVVAIVDAQLYRTSFLLIALVLTFLDEGGGERGEGRGTVSSPLSPPPSDGSWSP